MTTIDKPLTNLQLELIKLFSLNLSEPELLAVKRLLATHFADRATEEMDKLWDANDWSDETMDGFLFVCDS